MLDREFPRAMHFCLIKSQDSLRAILERRAGRVASPADAAHGALRQDLETPGSRRSSPRACTSSSTTSRQRINDIGAAISQTFFSTEESGRRVPEPGAGAVRWPSAWRCTTRRLPLRPADLARAADDPPAAGAAFPHADPRLLAARRAEAALPQLAAGPAVQLPGPRRVSREGPAACASSSICVAEMTVINPFDFFLEPDAEKFPFRYEPALARELTPFLVRRRSRTAVRRAGSRSIDRPPMRTIDFLVALNSG